MSYLLIENAGVAPTTAFTVLGATTSRQKDHIPGIIGTFGSGANMGTLDLLRHDLPPIIYCGIDRLEFFTKPLLVRDVSGENVLHRQVWVQYKGTSTRKEKLSWTIAYGEKDWSNVEFALREYISNAIDAMLTQGIPLKNVGAHVKVEIVDEISNAKPGYTRVFIPVNDAVQNFMNHIDSWFLHFAEPESLGKPILEKFGRNITSKGGASTSRAVIYRRGVRVREFMSDTIASLFDYNLDNLQMNESRCVDDWIAQQAAGKAMKKATPAILARVFLAMMEEKPVWEAKFPDYSLELDDGDNAKQISDNWNEAIKMVVGENGVVVNAASDRAIEQVKRKGYHPLALPAAYLMAALGLNLLTDDKVLTEDDRLDRKFFEPNEALTSTLDKFWDMIVKCGMTNGKEKPPCQLFFEHMNGESEKFGFYRKKTETVFVHRDYATVGDALDLTVLEELAHHCSGATDCSRDFQQWLMRFLHVAVFKEGNNG